MTVLDGTTLHAFEGFRFAVYPRRGGRVPELGDPQTLEWMGRFIGRIHAIGALRPFAHRPVLDIASFGEEPRDFLLRQKWIPPELVEAYASAANLALAGVQRAFEHAGSVAQIRLHGDCHAGNVLWTDAGPHFVDLDDCMNGPAVQDLWLFLSGSPEEMGAQLADILEGYEQFHEFDYRELRLIEALRTLRIIHYTAWIARRWQDPAFPRAFPWFTENKYWEDHVLALREQRAALDEPSLPLA